jgi:hypothetical protein
VSALLVSGIRRCQLARSQRFGSASSTELALHVRGKATRLVFYLHHEHAPAGSVTLRPPDDLSWLCGRPWDARLRPFGYLMPEMPTV